MALVPDIKRKNRLNSFTSNRSSGIGDRLFSGSTLFFSLIVLTLLLSVVVLLVIDSLPAIRQFGASFLVNSIWDPVKQIFGALPAIYGTLLSSLIGVIIAIPISFGAAIFLVELSPKWLSGPASFLIEMLAAIPSVIIGLWGLYVLVPIIRNPVETWLQNALGIIPLFQGAKLGVGFISAGIILAIMIIPIITAISREAINAVPQSQREAMLALGATRWEVIRKSVLPYCRSSLVGATILGLGRAMGETMAVAMVIGGGYTLTSSLFSPGSTIASKIANSFSEASGEELGSLIELALILFIVTLFVNVIARVMVWRLSTVKTTRE